MEQQFDVPQTIPSSPKQVGVVPKSWRKERMFTAVKTCECCGNIFRPWMNTNPDGSIKYYQKEKGWNKQRFCSISCSKMLENPMFQSAAREKMKATQNKRKHRFSSRTGNGHIIAIQKTVFSFL